jgi:hypothetical protein
MSEQLETLKTRLETEKPHSRVLRALVAKFASREKSKGVGNAVVAAKLGLKLNTLHRWGQRARAKRTVSKPQFIEVTSTSISPPAAYATELNFSNGVVLRSATALSESRLQTIFKMAAKQ